MKKSRLYFALLAFTALLMFFAACGEGTSVRLEGSDLKLISDSILAVEERISGCFGREKDDDCADVTMPSRRSSSSRGGSGSSSEETNPLTCTGLSQSGLAGIKITKPTVKCVGKDITTDATFDSAPDWTAPEEGTYNVTATASCDGSKTATCGRITIAAVKTGELTCTEIPKTGVAGEKITPPTVRCGKDTVSSPIFEGAPPSWNTLIKGTYTVSAKAPATGACKGAADAKCGTIEVFPRLYCAEPSPATVIAGTAVTKPAVTCGNSPATGLGWSDAPVWNNPVAGTYEIKVTADENCGKQTATCGTLTVTAPSNSSQGGQSSSSVASSSSNAATGPQECGEYKTSFCGGLAYGSVPDNSTTMPTTGNCLYIGDFEQIQPALNSTVAINGLENTFGDEWGAYNTKPDKKDDGYYVFVKTGSINSHENNGWKGIEAKAKPACTP